MPQEKVSFMYHVVFYKRLHNQPIHTFIDSCQSSLRTKIIRQVRYIQEFGLSFNIPDIKKIIGSPFWELRILGKDNVRIICVKLSELDIMVLHIFRKKKNQISKQDLHIIFNRYKNVLTNDIF